MRVSRGWTLAAAVVILAFGAGYGVRKAVEGGGGKKATSRERLGIPLDRARGVPRGITRSELLARFAGKPYDTEHSGPGDLPCLVYLVSDRPSTAWQFCFRHSRLVLSGPAAR